MTADQATGSLPFRGQEFCCSVSGFSKPEQCDEEGDLMSTDALIWRAQETCARGREVREESEDVRRLTQAALKDARALRVERKGQRLNDLKGRFRWMPKSHEA